MPEIADQRQTTNDKQQTNLLSLRLLFPAIALGLGWAIRGHFGHEWGAAWAGGMGGLAVLLAIPREVWLRRLPVLALLSAIGWGVGGMMSYGLIVGYGRADDLLNAWYGLAMLVVVGGLYGFIGGGLFGLGLETSTRHKPDWAQLLTQMVAGAVLGWGLLIYQLEWFMTPPRSELWASCLGAALALAWYLHRNGFHSALRVGVYAAIGAGFGFGFGNFLQTMGHLSGIAFNWWNVMEFSLGFFGGLGMVYAVASSKWPEAAHASHAANGLALVVLVCAIPATNLIQAFDTERFVEMATSLQITDTGAFVQTQNLIGWGWLILASGLLLVFWFRKQDDSFIYTYAPALFFGYSALYIMESHVRKGIFFGATDSLIPQYLYWANLLVLGILLFVMNRTPSTPPQLPLLRSPSWSRGYWIAAGVMLLMGILALVSISLHDGIQGSQARFSALLP